MFWVLAIVVVWYLGGVLFIWGLTKAGIGYVRIKESTPRRTRIEAAIFLPFIVLGAVVFSLITRRSVEIEIQ
jgi:hypothetical protein